MNGSRSKAASPGNQRMKLLQLIRKQNLTAPVFALIAVSAICTLLVAYRIIAGCQVRHAYLIWNLFLAWMPLGFAVLAAERFRSGTGVSPVRCEIESPESSDTGGSLFRSLDRRDACPTTNILRDRKFLALGIAWLLFFPNAPYIFTDLVHVLATWRQSFWAELMLILLVAMTGFLAGFLSLQVMHSLATRLWGRAGGWMFVAAVSGLSGFGVYLGRFVRLNSWDVLNPVRLLERTTTAGLNLLTQWHHTKFFILFSLFLLLAYVMLFALTQTEKAESGKAESGES